MKMIQNGCNVLSVIILTSSIFATEAGDVAGRSDTNAVSQQRERLVAATKEFKEQKLAELNQKLETIASSMQQLRTQISGLRQSKSDTTENELQLIDLQEEERRIKTLIFHCAAIPDDIAAQSGGFSGPLGYLEKVVEANLAQKEKLQVGSKENILQAYKKYAESASGPLVDASVISHDAAGGSEVRVNTMKQDRVRDERVKKALSQVTSAFLPYYESVKVLYETECSRLEEFHREAVARYVEMKQEQQRVVAGFGSGSEAAGAVDIGSEAASVPSPQPSVHSVDIGSVNSVESVSASEGDDTTGGDATVVQATEIASFLRNTVVIGEVVEIVESIAARVRQEVKNAGAGGEGEQEARTNHVLNWRMHLSGIVSDLGDNPTTLGENELLTILKKDVDYWNQVIRQLEETTPGFYWVVAVHKDAEQTYELMRARCARIKNLKHKRDYVEKIIQQVRNINETNLDLPASKLGLSVLRREVAYLSRPSEDGFGLTVALNWIDDAVTLASQQEQFRAIYAAMTKRLRWLSGQVPSLSAVSGVVESGIAMACPGLGCFIVEQQAAAAR